MKGPFYKLALLSVLLISLVACEKLEMSDIPNSVSYSIHSNHTGSDYNLQVSYPENYDSNTAYQTVYLLDGDLFFNDLASVVKEKYAQDLILIGIAYKGENKREAEFSYPADDMLAHSGEAKSYIRFLNTELIPFIEQELQINSSERTIAGHSLAGYFSLFLTFQQEFENPFENIISASPSLFWHDAYILELEQSYCQQNDSLNKTIYNTMGDLEGVAMNAMFNAFNKKVESRNYTGLRYSSRRFENTSHRNNAINSFDNGISKILYP